MVISCETISTSEAYHTIMLLWVLAIDGGFEVSPHQRRVGTWPGLAYKTKPRVARCCANHSVFNHSPFIMMSSVTAARFAKSSLYSIAYRTTSLSGAFFHRNSIAQTRHFGIYVPIAAVNQWRRGHRFYIWCVCEHSAFVSNGCCTKLERMKHSISNIPLLWITARRVKTMFPDRTTHDEETVCTAISTIKALHSVQAFQATTSTPEHALLMRPTSDIIVSVSDASLALRHFKTKHSQYPSDQIRKCKDSRNIDTSIVMGELEKRLLSTNNFYEVMAQHAGVKVGDIGHLGAYTYSMLLTLGRCHIAFLREVERLQLSQQMTKRFIQALGKLFQSSTALARVKDKVTMALHTSKDRNDLYKAEKYQQQQIGKYLPEIHRDAQQVLVVLRSLPTSEVFQRLQGTIQQVKEASAPEPRRNRLT
jgi:hypothetical protein